MKTYYVASITAIKGLTYIHAPVVIGAAKDKDDAKVLAIQIAEHEWPIVDGYYNHQANIMTTQVDGEVYMFPEDSRFVLSEGNNNNLTIN